MCFVILNFQTLRIFRTCNSSQTSQDEFTVCDFVNPEGGQNEIISSAEKTPDIEQNMKIVITTI